MRMTTINKACITLLAVASSISVLSVNQQPSSAYSITRSGFQLNKDDVGRTIDPITVAPWENGHSHEIRLTLNSYDPNKRIGEFSASVINNTPGALLTHLSFQNGRKGFSFKGPGSMGVAGDGQERVFTGLKVKFNRNDVLKFNRNKAGWWSDVKYNGKNDYETETVPEPLTIFGTALAGAFGLGFKRRRQKQQSQQEA